MSANPSKLSGSPKGSSPRTQQVLHALLRGLSEKQIAFDLGISRHTVHVYVKLIYQRHSVNSRAELMAAWIDIAPPSTPAGRTRISSEPSLVSDAPIVGC